MSSSPSSRTLPADITVRALKKPDFDAVVAVDSRIHGEPRRAYFQKRLDVALREPKRHMQFAAMGPDGLVGFLLARTAGGEYGRPEPSVVLEAAGVDPRTQHRGIGQSMVSALEALMRGRDLKTLVTQVEWRNHAMLRFLDNAGFSLAPRQILECDVDPRAIAEDEEDLEGTAHVVRELRSGDFDAIARIDKQITQQDRSDYLRRKFDEVLHESAIAVSLVAEDGGLPVGFVMARVDFGDFGHVEPAAALDTIGVHPGFANKGIATALLAQLMRNLSGLRVERIETELARETFSLLGFLYGLGFRPSQRLSFVKRLV